MSVLVAYVPVITVEICYFLRNLYCGIVRRFAPNGGTGSWQSAMNKSKENGCYVTSDTQSEPTALTILYYLRATLAIWTRMVASP